MEFSDLLILLAAAVIVLGFICAGLAIWETRTSQGAIAWAISLIAAPYIALPLYMVFGRRKFRGYVTARRAAEIEAQQDPEISEAVRTDTSLRTAREVGQMRVLETLADMPFTKGNDAKLLIDGRATFDAIFSAIDAAQDYVLVQFYIIRDDGLGTELSRRLMAATKRGVRTHLIYDEIGSASTKKKYFETMRDAGVLVSAFGSRRGRFNRFQLNFRNHRKIVVVDGQVAYVGGSNVGDEYLGLDPKIGDWRDTHVELRGPIVQAAQISFQEDWYWATGNKLELNWKLQLSEDGDKAALILATGPADRYESCSLFFVLAINAAVERIWIVSPYFVPDLDVIHALAVNSVDV
ncbi:MAG: phospholipase D-like domain-containing protein [Pseudomonadota bacterium]